MVMNIEEQFNLIAKEYDSKREKFIPCYEDFYENTTKFIAANIKQPHSILDLGAGTGLLTSFWYKYFPSSIYILVDIANDMLKIAKRRFTGINNILFNTLNYAETLPADDFDIVISALSIHHLCDNDKVKLFNALYSRLPQEGIFVNYDQFCASDYKINSWFNRYWVDHLYNSGLNVKDLALWEERKKLDKEISVDNEIDLLKNSGFSHSDCIFSSQKFSVIISIK